MVAVYDRPKTMSRPVRIVTAESVTQLGDVAGQVLVAGSHGGIVAAAYAARAGVRALIVHDAGIGKDGAGVAGLAWLEALGIAAAAVGHASARIGDGRDMLARGIISRANALAASLGVRPGLRCHDAAVLLIKSPQGRRYEGCAAEGRHDLARGVVGLDSIGMVEASDAGQILVIGSHASLHGGRAESALPIDASLVFFHEAGGDCSRLPVLAERGIAAAAAARESARIGDARSLWDTGAVSRVNRPASEAGLREGMSVQAAADRFIAARKRG